MESRVKKRDDAPIPMAATGTQGFSAKFLPKYDSVDLAFAGHFYNKMFFL